MRKEISILLILLSSFFTVTSQEVIIKYEQKVKLNLKDKSLFENHLSVDPKNDKRLLLSGMYINSKKDTDYKCFSSFSDDGGNSWKNVYEYNVSQAADPWGIITSKGTLISTFLDINANIYVYRSQNNGESWKKVTVLKGSHDHQTMIEDKENGRIYIVSIMGKNIYVNYSEDDGNSFNNPKKHLFSNLNSNTLTPIIMNGKLIIPFVAFGRSAINGSRRDGKYDNLENRLSWIISFSPSKGFGTPLFLSESCGLGFGVFTKDNSKGKHNNNLYYVCSNSKTNSIYFHYSNTYGSSWTPAIEIVKYGKKKRLLRNAFTGIPQITVNNKGVIGIVWKSLKDDIKEDCSNLYFTFSSDGGKTFSKPKKISSQISCGKVEKNGWGAKRYPEGGDYLGLTTNEQGEFVVVWPDSREGISKYYFAKIKVQMK